MHETEHAKNMLYYTEKKINQVKRFIHLKIFGMCTKYDHETEHAQRKNLKC